MADESASVITNIKLLIVPEKYKSMFDIFKTRLIKYGEELIKDCNARNKTENIDLTECWFMFQAACYAVSLDDNKTGDFYYNYINAKMKLNLIKL